MGNDLGIKINVEIDEKSSEQRIRQQLNNIEQTLKSSANIKVGLDAQSNSAAKSTKAINTQMSALGQTVQSTDAKTQSFVDKMSTGFKSIIGLVKSLGVAFTGYRAIREVISSVTELNKAFVDLKMATNASDTDVAKLMSSYNALGKRIGATTVEVANAANEWLRQGKSISDTNTLIQDSIILSKVAGISSAEATSYLTTAMRGYGVAVSDVLGIVDKLSAVDLVSATDAGGLAQGMAEVANNANLAGVSMDKLIGYLAVIGETTGASMSSVGNSLSTVFSRMSNIKLSRLDDYLNNGESLNNVETVLNAQGINLRDSVNEFRNFGDVLDEVAGKWTGYSSVEQRAIATAFAGKHQMEEFLVLMQNYSKATDYMTVAVDSSGTATKKMVAYADSVEASQKRAQAAWEGFSTAILSSDMLKFSYDSGTGILGYLTKIVQTVDGIPTIATLAAGALALKGRGFISKLDSGSYAPFWATGRVNALNQVDVDETALTAYFKAMDGGTDQATAFGQAMGKASQQAKQLAIQGGLTTTKISEFRAAQEASIRSTNWFSKSLSGLKAVVKGTGVAIANMSIAFAVGWGISEGVELIDNWITTADEAKQAADEVTASWEESADKLSSTKKSLDGIADEYATLSKGVDSFGQNVSLTSDEFDRYHEVTNEIADLIPDLVSGWDSEENAILKTRGSVEDLTSAYEDLVVAQKKKIAFEEADTFFEDFSNRANYSALFSFNGESGYLAQAEYIKELINTLNQYQADNPGKDVQWIDSSGLKDDIVTGMRDSDLWTDGQSIPELVNNLTSYLRVLGTKANSDISTIKTIANAYLYLSDAYNELDESARTVADTIVRSLDADMISQFDSSDALYGWIENNIINPLKGTDFSGIIDAKSLFDSSKMSVTEYSSLYDGFLESIKDFAPDVQEALAAAFSPDVDNLIANVEGKLQDAYDAAVTTLSLEDLKYAANLAAPEGVLWTWAELAQQIAQAKAEAAQTVAALTSSIGQLTTEQEALSAALDEQGKNGYISYETYQKLIDANADYASSFEMVDGVLRLNAESAYALADANSAIALAEAQAGQAAKKAELDENAAQLATIKDEMREMEKTGMGDAYDALVDQRDVLESQGDQLESEYQQYQAITSQIRTMTGAYVKYLRAQETANSGDTYDSLSGESDKLKEAIESKRVINDDVQSSVDYILGGNSADLEPEKQMERVIEAQKKYARYFDNPKLGTNNFLKDMLANGLATYEDGKVLFGDGLTGAEIAEGMGISEDALKAMIGLRQRRTITDTG